MPADDLDFLNWKVPDPEPRRDAPKKGTKRKAEDGLEGRTKRRKLEAPSVLGKRPAGTFDYVDVPPRPKKAKVSGRRPADGQLSVKPRILMNSDHDLKFQSPLKIRWDEETDPNDKLGGTLLLHYDEDSFNISDTGKLETVDLKITSQGAIKEVSWAYEFKAKEECHSFKLAAVVTNANFSFDSATTLSVPFIKLNTSFLLTNDYAASVGFVHYAYQAGLETGLDILEPINNRRIIKIRTDPSSLHVENTTNNLSVKLDPSGALKKDLSLGLDLKIDASGSIKLDPGLDDSCLAKTTTGLKVMVAPDGPLRKELLGLDIALNPDMTLTKSPIGSRGNYKQGNGIQISANIISLLPEVEDKLDQMDDALDKLDDIPDDIADKLGSLDDLADKYSDLSSIAGDIGKLAGIAAGTSALVSATTTALTAASLGLAARSQLQQLLTSKSALAMGGVGALFAGLFGAAGGLLGSALSKRGSNNTYISYNSISNGMIEEKQTDGDADRSKNCTLYCRPVIGK
ncbi:hypothetical protein HK097_002216 [Rhizophlyctis rosea]|uniref:Uncharacterized protein n=1 Tax=Rhizophlyctis rosea TaxID=64517 RepID=A0AAD5SH19_9FUNG|nr:hypothetical protein HK097_002216 [Rhizophlyctis rosea]